MEFSTFDNDNDVHKYDDDHNGNCAASYGGGSWWGICIWNNINGPYGDNGDSGLQYMDWIDFDNDNHHMALKSMKLMFRPVV